MNRGELWKFLKLEGKVVSIDLSNYPVVNANKILGILMNTIYNQVGGRNYFFQCSLRYY